MSIMSIHDLQRWIAEYQTHLRYYERAKEDQALEGDIEGSIILTRKRLNFLEREVSKRLDEELRNPTCKCGGKCRTKKL